MPDEPHPTPDEPAAAPADRSATPADPSPTPADPAPAPTDEAQTRIQSRDVSLALRVYLALAVLSFAASIVLLLAVETAQPVYYAALFLLFFAFCAVGAVVFTTQARAQLHVQGLAMSLGGPSVAWIIAVVLFHFLVVDDDFFGGEAIAATKPKLVEVLDGFAEFERDLGWLDTKTWIEANQEYEELLTNRLPAFDDLTTRVVPPEASKLPHPQVDTLYVYAEDVGVFKLQRIRGKRLDAESVKIPFRSDSTDPDTTPSSVFLQGVVRDGALVRFRRRSANADRFVEVDENVVDCLIVAYYPDFLRTDYMLVDTRAYSRDGVPRDVTHRLGVLGKSLTVDDARLFQARNSWPDERRLLFSALRSNPQTGQGETMVDWFDDWLQLLEGSPGSGSIPALVNVQSEASKIGGGENAPGLRELVHQRAGDDLRFYEILAPANVMTLLARLVD